MLLERGEREGGKERDTTEPARMRHLQTEAGSKMGV